MSRIFPSSSETKAKTFFEHYYVIKNEFVRLLKIQPNSGHFGLDLFYLFIIALIQTTVLPNISGGFSGFDFYEWGRRDCAGRTIRDVSEFRQQ